MRRRDFILASGSTVLSGLVASRIQRSAIGLDFEISTPDKDPSKVDSLVIEFETLKITPRYLDEKEPVSVQAKVEVDGRIEKSNEVQTSVVNGETKNLENNIDSIVVDGLNASSSISGDVTVSIEHPEIQDSYSQRFYLNGSEIPDSEDLYARYDFSQYDTATTTNIPDLTGNGHDLNSGKITGYGSINGVQSGMFDGTDDTLYGASLPSNPNTVAAVFKLDSDADLSTEHHIANFHDSDFNRFGWDGNNWELYQGSVITGSTDSAVNILVGYLDGGGNSILREDGSQTASGYIGNGGSSDITLGSAEPERNERYFDGEIGEVLFYDLDKTSIFGDIESYLADKWGVTI